MDASSPAKEIYGAFREDIAEGRMATKLLLGGMAVGLAFEWGTGNEALLGLMGTHIYNATHNEVATGMTAGSISFIEQSLLGVGMALNIHKLPATMEKVQGRLGGNEDSPSKESSLSNRALTAFALGSAVSLLKGSATEKKPLRHNIRQAIGTSALIGAGVALIAGGSATITKYGAEHGLENQSHTLVNILSNPLTYVGIFGAKFTYDKAKEFIAKRRLNRNS